jgi:hypothetical protein
MNLARHAAIVTLALLSVPSGQRGQLPVDETLAWFFGDKLCSTQSGHASRLDSDTERSVVLDSSMVAQFCKIWRSAVQQPCDSPPDSAFVPSYWLGLDMSGIEISEDASAWQLSFQGIRISSMPVAWCVRDSLRAFISRVFPDSGVTR